VDWNGIAVLILILRRFVSCTLHLGLTIGDASRGKASNGGGDGEEVGNGLGVHKSVGDFLLSDNRAGVLAAEGDAGEARCGGGGFECILHLV